MCPDGVPMVALGEICNKITDGSHNPPAGIDYSSFRMISSQNIFNDKLILNDIRFLNEEDFWKENRRTDVSQGDLLLTIVGAIGRCYVVKNEDLPFTCQRSVAVLKLHKTNVIPEYVHECIVNINSYLETQANGAAQKGLYLKQIAKIQIPLPPLSIQRRIVEILDKFTSLVSSLDSEIALRQKQYEYYRNKLLSFEEGDEGVEWKKLGDVGNVYMCKRIMKAQTDSEGEVPFFKIGTFGKEPDAYISRELFETYKTNYNYPEVGDVLISAAGTIGRTVVFDGTPSYFQDSNIVWIRNDESLVYNSYLKYFYTVAEWDIDYGGVVARLYNDKLKATLIPIPPKSVQHSIVQTLDTFESLIANLKKERKLRQKQYEYYREKLLTFE